MSFPSPATTPPASLARLRMLWLVGLPAMAALILFVASASYFADVAQLDRQRLVLDAQAKALRHGQAIERMVTQASAAASALSSVVPLARRSDDLDLAAEQLLLAHRGIAALELQRGEHTQRWAASDADGVIVRTGEVAFEAGARRPQGRPFARFEEGRIVLSQALFAYSRDLRVTPWGHTRAIIGLRPLMQATAAADLLRSGHDIQLLYLSADGSVAGQIAGTPGGIPNAQEYSVLLPEGDILQLRVGPRGGGATNPLLYAELSLSAIGALLFGILLHVVLRRLGSVARRLGEERAGGAGPAESIAATTDSSRLHLVRPAHLGATSAQRALGTTDA